MSTDAMNYVRDHVKRYWGMAYRRTIGLAITTFAMVMAIGIAFTVLTKSLALTGPFTYIAFWLVITAGGIVVMLANFLSSHITSVGYMTDEEHTIHARFMAWWMVSIVVGIALFFLPALFAGAEFLPLALMFALGGVMLTLYFSISVLFKHSYHELAIGTAAFWIMLVVGLLLLGGSFSRAAFSQFALYFSAMSIMTISGFVGIAMLINASRDSIMEFTRVVDEMSLIPRNSRLRRGSSPLGRNGRGRGRSRGLGR